MYDVRPAGFWIRAVALVIDMVVLTLVERSLGLVARRVWGASVEDSAVLHSMTSLFTLLFAVLYVTLSHAGTGQTIGKLAVGAHVVLADGEPVPVGASLLRFFAYFASCATLGFGYLMAALRSDKRALHDLIAGTRVERRLPARAPSPTELSDAGIPRLSDAGIPRSSDAGIPPVA